MNSVLNSDKTCKNIAEELGIYYNNLVRRLREYKSKGDLADKEKIRQMILSDV